MLEQPGSTTETPIKRPRRKRHPYSTRGADPLAFRVNGNTIAGRRIRHQWRVYLKAMNHPQDPLARANAADAAELRIAVEDMQAAQRAGQPVHEDLVRLRNALDRAERKLGLRPDGAAKPVHIPLRERLLMEED